MSAYRAIRSITTFRRRPMVISIDGKKTVVQPNKTGYIHYLDAKTGKFIKATPFADKITWIKGYDSNGRPIDMVGSAEGRRRSRWRSGRACWAG